MKTNFRNLLIVLALAAAAVALTFVAKPHQAVAPAPSASESGAPTGQTPAIQNTGESVVTATYVKYYGHDGRNALELLQGATTAQVKQFSFGAMVEGIGGVTPDAKHFWKLYINGQASSVGADQLQTHDGDVIEWKLEVIQNNQ